MATILVRDFPDQTEEILRKDAAQLGISLESYLKQILEDAATSSEKVPVNIISIAEKYFGAKYGIDLDLPKRTSNRQMVEFN